MNETNHNQAAPAPATDEREAFEAVASDNGQWPKAIERDARGNYVLLTTANGWMWWRAARAALAATPPATEESSAVEVQAEPVAFKMVAAPVVPPEPVSTYIEVLECSDCGHIGINDADGSKAACNTCEWQGDSPIEDKCPGCNAVGTMTSACPKCGARTSLIAETNLLAGVSAPAAPAPVVLPEPAESTAPTLRAMALNYTPGHSWDHLDADACLKGAAEIDRMRALLAQAAAPAAPAVDALDATDRECLAIGRAVNRAALELPADGEIRIDIENGAGAVYVLEPKHGDWRYIDSGDVFSAQINAAIDAAIQAAKGDKQK